MIQRGALSATFRLEKAMFPKRYKYATYALIIALAHFSLVACGVESEGKSRVSKEAAASCDLKVTRLEAFIGQSQVKDVKTRLSEEELNSYLAFVLSPTFHPSLQSILFEIEESSLMAVATIDFDRLELSQEGFLTQLLAKILSGIHTLTLRGVLISGAGKARFQLAEATFDSQTLPKVVVEEIISAVGRKQNPPFDPMQPSDMPFDIKEVEIHTGYIIVTQ